MANLQMFLLIQLVLHMRKGGCALFLETIIQVHGILRVSAMLRRLRESSSKETESTSKRKICTSLLECTCEKKQKYKYDAALKRHQEMIQKNPSYKMKRIDWSFLSNSVYC